MADVGVDEVCSKQSQHLQFWFAPSAVTLGVVLVLNSFFGWCCVDLCFLVEFIIPVLMG